MVAFVGFFLNPEKPIVSEKILVFSISVQDRLESSKFKSFVNTYVKDIRINLIVLKEDFDVFSGPVLTYGLKFLPVVLCGPFFIKSVCFWRKNSHLTISIFKPRGPY